MVVLGLALPIGLRLHHLQIVVLILCMQTSTLLHHHQLTLLALIHPHLALSM
jgi:hypothetical protein